MLVPTKGAKKFLGRNLEGHSKCKWGLILGGFTMERKLETLFDLVTDTVSTDKDTPHVATERQLPQSVEMAQAQAVLTTRRIAHWLRGNARLYDYALESQWAIELRQLADDLEFLAQAHYPVSDQYLY